MKISFFAAAFVGLLTLANGCTPTTTGTTTETPSSGASAPGKKVPVDLSKFNKAYFAMGCFWCVEAVFEGVKGVEEVVSGYAGGQSNDPTYEEVGTGRTGHAEVVKVYYDSSVVDFPTLLRVYFAAGDPTQVNGQGPDHGSQYRSIIFYANAREKELIDQKFAELNAGHQFAAPLAVEVSPFERFWPAEDYHQDYVPQHPENPYVRHESIPRKERAHAQLKGLLK